MPNAFQSAQLVERESRKILEPLLERNSDGRFVYTDKGRLAKEFQAHYGDVLIQEKRGKEMLAIEMKAERKSSDNLFLELWSNGSQYKLGWMYTNNADLLFYHFLDSDELYIIKLPDLKKWFWFGIGPARKGGIAHIHTPGCFQFRHKVQRAYEQMNDTWGVITPIGAIKAQVGIKKINPLGLFGFEKAA